MSLFPRTSFYGPDASFTPLFRLLDDFENYRGEVQGTDNNNNPARRQVQAVRSFTPKFDVRETENAYELHGELAGIDRKDVNIEFTEPQALVIRGRVERSYTSGTPPAGFLEGEAKMSGAIENGGQQQHHKVTVEDEEAEKAKEKEPEKEQKVTKHEEKKKHHHPKAPAEKYWVSERSVGEFSRTFNFPTRVDQEAVQASLNNGLLTVIVPKAKKHESRRITIN